MPIKRLYIDLPAELVNKLKVAALEKGLTMKGLVAMLIKRHLSSIEGAKTRKEQTE